MSIRLPVHGHTCACLYMRMYIRMCVCERACMHTIHVCMCTYVCIGPMCGSCILAVGPGPPSPDKNPGSTPGSARLSIHPLKIVKWSIKEISVFGLSVN